MAKDKKPKFYVVWAGYEPGVYDNWSAASAQVTGFPGAKFKAFGSEADARAAFTRDYVEFAGTNTTSGRKSMAELVDLGVIADSIAVDAACAGVPGPMEYRGLHVETGAEIFHMGPYEDATNNIGEFLGIVHALAFLHKRAKHHMPVYSDSRTALAWVQAKECRTTHPRSPRNSPVFELVRRAEQWLREHEYRNPVLKWETSRWGEIPADYGRK